MTVSELMRRREQAADFASDFSRHSGRFAATATAYGTYLASQPNPVSQTGATVQFGLAGTATVIGFGASAVEQILRPNVGAMAIDFAAAIAGELSTRAFPLAAPLTNEIVEQIKNTPQVNDLTNRSNQ